jgi:hypothetical protein
MECDSLNHIFHMVPSSRQHEYHWRPSREELGDAWELIEKTSRLLQDQLEYLLASRCFKYSWGLLACRTWGCSRTTRQGLQDYLKPSCTTTKYSGACRMDIPRPTTQVGTRTDYLVGPCVGHRPTTQVGTRTDYLVGPCVRHTPRVPMHGRMKTDSY